MMAIKTPDAPPGLARAAIEQVSAMRQGRGGRFLSAETGGSTSPRACDPVPIYSIPMEACAQGHGAIEQAQQSGWRVVTQDKYGQRLVDFAGIGDDASLSAIRRDTAAGLLANAGKLAADRSSSSDVNYEVRVLDVGRLGQSALWLHSESAPDQFFTIERQPRELTGENLMAELAPRAQQLMSRQVGQPVAAGEGPDGGLSTNERGGGASGSC